MSRKYYVYILASESRQMYVGITNDVVRRVLEHRTRWVAEGYSARLEITRLVYCEPTDDVRAAIRREKQIKGWPPFALLRVTQIS